MANGILLLNKPTGLSTFDLIRVFKKAIKPDFKVGHAGTLDVFANGLSILLLGSATKNFSLFQTLPKTYLATARLGYSSPTLDIEGDLTPQTNPPSIGREKIEVLFNNFPRQYHQSVPAYSAAKHQGQPLYRHARKGNAITNKTKPVTIHQLELIAYRSPLVTFNTSVSSGTYIRQLSCDLFTQLKLDSFLSSLTRTRIGPYQLKDAINLDTLYNKNWHQHLITKYDPQNQIHQWQPRASWSRHPLVFWFHVYPTHSLGNQWPN